MSTIPTLYSICFDYIKNHTEELISLDGIPYKPTVENIIKYLFSSPVPLNKSILSLISTSHSKELREAQFAWTKIMFHSLTCSVHPRLMTLSRDFPKFVTHLKIGTTDVCDDDMFLFANFISLIVLDLSGNKNITDRSISYITTMALNTTNGRGLPHLKEIYLHAVKGITDKSLKFFRKLDSISKLSLTGTSVTSHVAITFLSALGFELSNVIIPHFTERLNKVNFKFHQFIEKCSCEYPIPINRKMYSDPPAGLIPPIFLHFSRNTQRDPQLKYTPVKRKSTKPKQDPLLKRPRMDEFMSNFVKEIANDESN